MLLDLIYLRVVWQLCTITQEGIPNRLHATHVAPDLNRVLVDQSIYLEDMTPVRQPDEAIIKARYFDQLGIFPALFRESGRRQVGQIREGGKLDGVLVDLPGATRYSGYSGLRRFVYGQFSHGCPILVLEGVPEGPPCVHIPRPHKDGRKMPSAFDLDGCRLRR